MTFRKFINAKNYICIPNVDQISQSTAEILLLPVAGNKRPPYFNSTSGFDFDVILILQDGGHSVTNLLSVSGLATSDVKGLKLSTYQISTRYSIHGQDITTSG